MPKYLVTKTKGGPTTISFVHGKPDVAFENSKEFNCICAIVEDEELIKRIRMFKSSGLYLVRELKESEENSIATQSVNSVPHVVLLQDSESAETVLKKALGLEHLPNAPEPIAPELPLGNAEKKTLNPLETQPQVPISPEKASEEVKEVVTKFSSKIIWEDLPLDKQGDLGK